MSKWKKFKYIHSFKNIIKIKQTYLYITKGEILLEKTLLLIDGSSLLSSSFYGNLPEEYKKAKTEDEYNKALPLLLHTSDGKYYTNGIYGFLRIMFKIIREHNPTHLAIAWDKSRNTFRKKLFPDYKAHRKAVRQELISQFDLTQRFLEYIGVQQFVFEDYEADDIIGTLSHKFSDEASIIILSKDRDVLQLINDNTSVWQINPFAAKFYKNRGINWKNLNIPEKTILYDKNSMMDYLGITPEQVIDLKALQGDASDNIPGIPGIGEKTAIGLIKYFGSIDEMYRQINTMTKDQEKKIKEDLKALGVGRVSFDKIIEGKSSAELSKKLTEIKKDIPELKHVSLDSLIIHINDTRKEKALQRLEMKSLLEK